MNLEQSLIKNSAQVNILNRRYNVPGPVSPDTVRTGYQRHGSTYLAKLIDILRDDHDISNSSPVLGPPTFEEWEGSQKPKGNFWKFWDNLLGAARDTSGTYKVVREDVYSPPWQQVYYQNSKQINTGLILVVFAVILIALIYIFKKK